MLRLQPSELAVTFREVQEFKDRQRLRQLQQLDEDAASCRSDRPQFKRGPARQRDSAITARHPGPLAHSVASSSDTDTDDFETEAESLITREIQSFCGADCPERADSPDLEQHDLLDEGNIQLNVDIESDHDVPLSHPAAHRHEPTRHAQITDSNADAPLPPHEEFQALSIGRLGRRFRPRSYSDPSSAAVPSLRFGQRRRVGIPPHRCTHSSATSDASDKSKTLSDTARLSGSTLRSCSSESSLARSSAPRTDGQDDQPNPPAPMSAIFEAVRGRPSPLDSLIHTARLFAQASGPSWTCNLPRRPHSAREASLPERPSTPAPTRNNGDDGGDDGDDDYDDDYDRLTASTPRPRIQVSHHTPEALHRRQARPVRNPRSPLEVDHAHLHASPVRPELDPSPPQHRIPRRPVPHRSVLAGHSPSSTERPALSPPPPGRTQSAEMMIQRQRYSFFANLAQSHGGTLPEDAHIRWLRFLEHLSHTQPTSPPRPPSDPPQPHYLRRRPVRDVSHHGPLQGSDFAGNRGPPTVDDVHPERANPRGLNLEFAVTRGGRPRAEMVYRAPMQLSRSRAVRGLRSTSSSRDQENVDASHMLDGLARAARLRSRRASSDYGDGEY